MKILLSLACMSSLAHGHILKTRDINDVARELRQCGPQDIIFLDVDDTLQTVKAQMFAVAKDQNSSEGSRFIDQMKKDRANIPHFEDRISQWRLSRKVQLVDPQWPALIQAWKERGASVYGLTQMDTGRSGVMERIEDWRYKELHGLGVLFTPDYEGVKDKVLFQNQNKPSQAGLVTPAVFYHGIFMTGAFSKGEIVKVVLEQKKPARVILVDDRESHIRDVEKVCKDHQVPFTGILFRGTECIKRPKIEDQLLKKIIDYQKKAFLEGQWIEDEEALQHFEKNSMLQGK